MKVRFWGTRGSLPVSGPAFTRHGGSTTCLEVEYVPADEETSRRLIVDCGSGLAAMSDHFEADERTLVYQTHMHWDHIQGLPFFKPLYENDNQFHFTAVDRDGRTLEDVFAGQMSRPMFPVELDELSAEMTFERMPEEGSRSLDGLAVRWTEMIHPSGSTALRFEHDGAVFVFSGDVEVRKGCRRKLIEFADGADVLLMDAQYFPDEYDNRRGFGHSTPRDAVGVAAEAGVDRLYMTHHDPDHDDERLLEKVELARDYSSGDFVIANARDRIELDIRSDAISERPIRTPPSDERTE